MRERSASANGVALSSSGCVRGLELGNLSLRCWLQLLSQEGSPELHGDSSSLAVRVGVAGGYLGVCALGLVGNDVSPLSLSLSLLLSLFLSLSFSLSLF